MKRGTILVVDDEDLIRWSFEKELTKEGYEVITAKTGEEGVEVFNREIPDLTILDIKLPGMGGMEVLKKIKEIDPYAGVIMITAYADVETAVAAMKMNASDYLSKPFDLEEVKVVIEKNISNSKIKKEFHSIKQREKKYYSFSKIITRSPDMQSLINMAKKIASSEARNILIEGESGTGKELLSRAIHYESRRSQYPFMGINCAAIPETLLESELFGFEKGAFTDARSSKKGLLELANGGTILLDEISEMPLSSQAKLLRVLETRTFKRLGGTRDISVDVRIIATTNKNLAEEIGKGKFREDLYYRLNVMELKIPPLRERSEDIQLLVEYFIGEFNREFRKNIKGTTKSALNILKEYTWPGNVRELKNVIERAVILREGGKIDESDLRFISEEIRGVRGQQCNEFRIVLPSKGYPLEEIEKMLIEQALKMAKGNKSRAAELLSISRDTLKYRMKKFELE